MNTKSIIALVIAVFVIVALIIVSQSDVKLGQEFATNKVPYIEIAEPAGFVNTNNEPFTIGQYVGEKVILLDFMTYSCINCQRTFPYVVDWYEKYKDDGLIVIGIHTPEFAFERVKENVERELGKFGITFPVVLDNDYGTWRAYGNRFWPRKYLIDINGNIVYDHIGEGAYEETEAKIVELLEERANVLGEEFEKEEMTNITSDKNSGTRSPEIYFGANRNEYLANGTKGRVGTQIMNRPTEVRLNDLVLVGSWNITEEFAENLSSETRVIFKYQAQEVNAVFAADTPTELDVYKDGLFIKTITVFESTLYSLIDDAELDIHTLELVPKSSGVLFYTFTFG